MRIKAVDSALLPLENRGKAAGTRHSAETLLTLRKEAALGELQVARAMRNESRRTFHKLAALIADEMAITKATSDYLVKNVTSTVEDPKNDKVDGVMSRFISRIGNRGASSQAISGTTSSIDGIKGGRAGGFQKRCTYLDDASRSLQIILSATSQPHAFNSTCSEAEPSSTSNLPDVPIAKPTTLCQEPSVAVDANPIIPIRKGHDLSPSVGEKTKRLKIHRSGDKRSGGRMKLGNISNRVYS
ncbi:hypothetical protein JB92DRAFT_2838887 [Gautieria morchelliformis]|nr:hypothetical protein JB92DRAFT_2838887 [Gautieria morchelliformis]